MIAVLSRAHLKEVGGGGSRNDFKFGTFIGLFQSDGAASTAAMGLICSKVTRAFRQRPEWERRRERTRCVGAWTERNRFGRVSHTSEPIEASLPSLLVSVDRNFLSLTAGVQCLPSLWLGQRTLVPQARRR